MIEYENNLKRRNEFREFEEEKLFSTVEKVTQLLTIEQLWKKAEDEEEKQNLVNPYEEEKQNIRVNPPHEDNSEFLRLIKQIEEEGEEIIQKNSSKKSHSIS